MPCGSLARTRESRANRANRFKSHFMVDTEVTRLHLYEGLIMSVRVRSAECTRRTAACPVPVLRGRQKGFGLGEKRHHFCLVRQGCPAYERARSMAAACHAETCARRSVVPVCWAKPGQRLGIDSFWHGFYRVCGVCPSACSEQCTAFPEIYTLEWSAQNCTFVHRCE